MNSSLEPLLNKLAADHFYGDQIRVGETRSAAKDRNHQAGHGRRSSGQPRRRT
jgi:hypothetical protein